MTALAQTMSEPLMALFMKGAQGAGWINIELFGARPGADATDAIAAAVAKAKLTGGIVTAPPGRYYNRDPIEISTAMGGIFMPAVVFDGTVSSGDCFQLMRSTPGTDNYDDKLFHLPSVENYANGAGMHWLGAANVELYIHHIYNCLDGMLFETTDVVRNTINSRINFMKIGTIMNGACIHFKMGAGATAAQSLQGLHLRGNFCNGYKYGVWLDGPSLPNQLVGCNDITIDVDGFDGALVPGIIGNTHGNTVIDGIADTSLYTGISNICGPGVDVGTTFTITGPNSILLSQPATTTGTFYFDCTDAIGFYCPVNPCNGPFLFNAYEFMGGHGKGDIIVPDGANGLEFICGWPQSPAYGAIQAKGSSTFKNTFNQGATFGNGYIASLTSDARATYNGGQAAGWNRFFVTVPLNPAGYPPGGTETFHFYSPLLNQFNTPLRVFPNFNAGEAILQYCSTDDNPSGLNIPYQIRGTVIFIDGTGPNPSCQLYVEVGV